MLTRCVTNVNRYYSHADVSIYANTLGECRSQVNRHIRRKRSDMRFWLRRQDHAPATILLATLLVRLDGASPPLVE
jgi:hypothetical protein